MSKTVLITGAATGIGHATVARFVAAGWNVVAATRRPESTPSPVLNVEMDVTDSGQIGVALDRAIDAFGSIDVVVNNAGVGEFGVFEAIADDKIRASYEVNVFGVMNVMRAALPHFRSRQAGTFVNISSTGGVVGMPAMSIYLSTKFALEGFSECVWYELASQGIAVKLVEPGGVETPFLGKIAETRRGNPPHDDYAAFVAHNDRVMSELAWARSTPAQVADIVFEAASDGTSRLRYFAGPGVAHLADARHSFDDERYEIFTRSEFTPLSKLPDRI